MSLSFIPVPRRPVRALGAATFAAVVCALLSAVPADAARLLITGHDIDHHCGRNGQSGGNQQCNFVRSAVEYVRNGAPDRNKPLLILDRARPGEIDPTTGQQRLPDWVLAMDRAYVGPPPAYQVVDPGSAEFNGVQLNVANYSAIVLASAVDTELESDATQQDLEFGRDIVPINAKKEQIRAFFNQGGGILVPSGGSAGRTNSAAYYSFLPITAIGRPISPPFTLTQAGRSLGLGDGTGGTPDDINCCVTHLTFDIPATESPLNVAEQDRAGRAETLIADVEKLEDIAEPETKPADVFAPVPSGGGSGGGGGGGGGGSTDRNCTRQTSVTIKLRRPRGVAFARVTVYRNGKLVKRMSARQLGRGRTTRAFKIKLKSTGTSKLRIVVRTAAGKNLTLNRSYRRCRS